MRTAAVAVLAAIGVGASLFTRHGTAPAIATPTIPRPVAVITEEGNR
jgi:hypothetical protein